ncbi:MAG TPA: CHAT domain-containing protein [Nocardioides sp.]|uniref:CHAT domain-containing protein n=1 Tax=Nocardioides sp. TaxID=35761 RepID=UPI002B6C20A3|nr:CHAT domain-containing protein [Nocardioides sp.]HTW16189.1 CHAT domain-containing protein [Nocardioides sp.]
MAPTEELHRRGVAAMNAGRLGAARSLLRKALAAATEPGQRAQVEASLAYVETDATDPTTGLALVERALANRDLPRSIRGVLLCQRALILRRTGQAALALEAFGQAIAALDEQTADRGKALLNRGTVHLDRREIRAADRDFGDAARTLAAAGDRVGEAKAIHNQGYTRFLAGDLVGALDLMASAHEILAPRGQVLRAVGLQDRAEVLLAAGLSAEGRRMLDEAGRAYGSRRLRQLQAEAELTLARSVLDQDPPQARLSAQRARRRFLALGADAWRARADAVLLAADAATGRSVSERRVHDVSTELETQGIRWEAIALRLRTLPHVRTPVPRGAPLGVRLLDREARARAASAAGRRTDALGHLRAGLADLHAWQSSFGSLDLQTGVAGHGVRLGVRGLALAVESRKPAVLFEWSERARMLASRVQPVQAPEDEQLVADLAELRELASGESRGDPVREAQLRQRVRERAWQHRGSGEVVDPVGMAELQGTLDPETALVAYVVTADVLVALVVTDADATWVDLGARSTLDDLVGGLLPDLDVAAADLAQPMAGAVRAALAARLDELAALLVAPVLDAVGDRRVVLTPSGVLAGMPWTLLPGYVGRPVTVAQSATSWLARRTTPLRTRTAGFVAGPRVMRAEDEVNAAVKEWPAARVLTGASATAAAVSELAEQVDVLHVAAHGRHSAENPLFSGLMLADGSWFGYDIDRLRSVPDVVLLSACEVGRSTVRWGEELIGMSAAWLHAGARCVIASAAAVNDAAAYDVLVAVHQQLAAGVDPATALAEAVPAVTTGTAPVPLVCFG